MVIVKTVEDFRKHNEEKLRKFMVYKTGIYNKDEIDDVMQEFYIKLIQTKALDSFDLNEVTHGTPEKVFKVYIVNLFCWLLHHTKKKRDKEKITKISWIHPKASSEKDPSDVFNYVSSSELCSDFQIDSKFYYDSHFMDKESQLQLEVEDFKKYIKKTESKKKAKKMICFLENRSSGCRSTDIAQMLGVSNNMIKFLKFDTYKSYKRYVSEWKK